ncbi:family 2 encapsulin nanocompartment cargo protein terpene cyclase [Streptomyces sp. NPDC053048]|uniref:family 2 encapsulin nanocompartment cargo protein terpene cyclase n=1 Tax=Streptomyces sp. NPDC053048 TaxID=3365694 RepID=UPI0037D89A45
MSLLSRMHAPVATHDLARLVAGLLSHRGGAAPLLPGAPAATAAVPERTARRVAGKVPAGPTGLGTSGLRIPAPRPAADAPGEPHGASAGPVPELYCPPPLRDDPALADEVNDRLIGWAQETGIYRDRLDRVRATGFGRLMMLAHPGTDDPERLLVAARCALAEWATDDYYCDDETTGSAPALLGSHLGLAYPATDPSHPPAGYAPESAEGFRADPVRVALRSSFEHLARYADATQTARLRQEIAVLFVGYAQEGSWRSSGRVPAVWEYLAHRQINSFMPCIALVDVVDGYRLSAAEYHDPRVRRVVTMAATASTLVNDLYSLAKEQDSGGVEFSLPTVIAEESGCSLHEAVERSVAIHDELVHTFEREAAALALTGSPELRRFLAGVWAWLGGNLEWHRGSARYAS